MNGIFVAITVADGYLLHGCAVAPIEQRLDECLDAPPREQAPHPASGLLSNLFAIRHRLLDQALWRRPLARRGRRVQRVAGSSHLNASNSNSGADLERQLAAEFDDDVAAPLLRWPRASANVNGVAAEESTEPWRSTGPPTRGIGIWNS